ncbi:glycosyltransferase [Nostoc sp.]|uniref:glycosyltransferase n=1 Tax=Nostoc sp. TaxID=1180 RepID=UPI002FF514D2
MNRTVFIVLGSPRSGTSAISHMINKFGVDFGNPENFLDTKQHSHNPIFFELDWVNEYNNKIIYSIGSKWENGDNINPDYKDFDNNLVLEIKQQLYSLIDKEWKNQENNIGIKDPRFCFTFPVWQDVLLKMGYSLKIIFVFRHPLGYLNSNKKVNGFTNTKNLNLWLQHNLAARYFINDQDFYLIDYDNVMSNPILEAEKMASRFKLDINLVNVSSSVIDKYYYHNQAIGETGNLIIDDCYKSLKENNLSPSKYINYRNIYLLFKENISELQEDVYELEHLVNQKEHQLQYTQSELEQSQSQLQYTQSELEQSQSQIQYTQSELEQSQSQIQYTQSELEQSQSQLQYTQSELEQSQSQLQYTQGELEQSQSQLQYTQGELERAQLHLQDTQAQLENYQHQLQATQTELESYQYQLKATQTESENWQDLVCWMETSKFWKLRKLYLNIKQRITNITNITFSLGELAIKSITVIRKEGYETFNKRALNFLTYKKIMGFRAKTTFTETLVTGALQILADSSEYGQWIKEYEPTYEELKKQKNKAFSFNYQPVISVILPVYKLPIAILKETINSVLEQTYTRWELCIAFADISNFDTIKYIKNLSLQDKRIKLAILPENKGISGNSNVCLEIATGEFIALVDHDDLLSSWAFYEVVNQLNKQPDLDFIYSDKDCICANSRIRSRLLLKPEWSPEILYSANYLTHLCIARRELVNSIGGFRTETDGAQDWDLFLRITEQTSRIARINSVLYHWRIIQGSTSLGIDSKPYALEAQLKSVKDHLSRTQLPATISPHPECGFRLEWKTPPAKVSIVINGEVSWEHLSACISNVSLSADPNLHKVKIVLPECNYYSHKSEIQILTEQINLTIDWLLIREGNSQLATLAEAARQDTPDIVLFVSGQVARFQEGWIEELSGWVLNHPDIGFTSALILTNQNIVVEAGLIVDKHDNGFPLFYGSNLYTWEVFGGALWYRNCSASSPWAVAFNYNHYLNIGGLPTDYSSVQHSMIKLCQASRASNKRGLVNPHARVFLADLPEYNLPIFDDSLANDPYFHPAFTSVVPLKLRSKNGETS